MPFCDRLNAETRDCQERLASHPFIRAGLAGELALSSYMAFLHEAYHHVRHTAPIFMTAGARCTGAYEWLRKPLVEYMEEEIGHDEWILNDIEACGGNREQAKVSKPSEPIELMVAFTYDVAQRQNPIGVFGMVHCLEGTSIQVATPAAEALQKGLGLPPQAFTYLSSHGSLDIEHYEFFKGLMNQVTDRADQDWIIHCARRVFNLYTAMFDTLPLASHEVAA
jgi:pyrroloquinoline quinone (PQQ) biosynthesis protein C